MPFGLFIPLANFAKNLLYETPADDVKPVCSKISRRIKLAIFDAGKSDLTKCVISKYASSSDIGSTISV